MEQKSYTFLVSGYGAPDTENLKIYEFNETNQHVTKRSGVRLENPTYAAYARGHIHTLSEINHLTEQSPLYLLNLTPDKLPICSIQDVVSKGIVHLDYSIKHNTLFGSCYGSGEVFSVGVNEFGYTGVKSIHRLPRAPNGISRAHCSQLNSNENFLYATHFNLDNIYCFHVLDGYLTLNEHYPYLSLDDHTGPRHIIFHNKMPIAYITCEKSNEVIVVQENHNTGELTVIQKIRTLPADYTETSYVANGFITPDANYFLVANRGANTIVTFKINDDGTLIYLSTSSCHGHWPRHIDCTKDGKYILICNQKSNEFVIAPLNHLGEVLSPCSVITFNGCAFALDI